MIDLITYVGNESEIKTAITAGASALILEDSKVSIRSYQNDFDVPHVEKLGCLAQYARQLNPAINLSVNCDGLYHHQAFNQLNILLDTMKIHQLSTIRIQDIGLIPYLKH